MPIYLVTWQDASCLEEWSSHDESTEYAREQLPHTKTVGFLVHDGRDHIAIAQTDDPEEQANIWKIPRGCIVKTEILRHGET